MKKRKGKGDPPIALHFIQGVQFKELRDSWRKGLFFCLFESRKIRTIKRGVEKLKEMPKQPYPNLVQRTSTGHVRTPADKLICPSRTLPADKHRTCPHPSGQVNFSFQNTLNGQAPDMSSPHRTCPQRTSTGHVLWADKSVALQTSPTGRFSSPPINSPSSPTGRAAQPPRLTVLQLYFLTSLSPKSLTLASPLSRFVLGRAWVRLIESPAKTSPPFELSTGISPRFSCLLLLELGS